MCREGELQCLAFVPDWLIVAWENSCSMRQHASRFAAIAARQEETIMRDRGVLIETVSLLALSAAGVLIAAPAADARITKIEIASKQSPTFGGYAFEGVGPYEKIVGKAFGELDPNDPKNAVIVDIELAPKNANGKVEYSFDFYILKPIDLSKGNHKVMYEPPNRGRKTHAALNRGAGGNDPGSLTDGEALANTFLLPRGYTMVWSGWDYSAGTSAANFNMTITLPVAKNP